MKTGLKIAAAMMVIMSGTVIAAPFSVSSADMRDGQTLAQTHWFGGFGCTGGNISPQIAWKNAPAGTRSFAVTAYDPDAPTGSGWWHWTVVNLPADTTGLPPSAGAAGNARLPAGASQVRSDYGVAAWGGMCPPEGDAPHRYIFTVHALKVPRLDLPADATAALASYMVHANSLGKATFTARYGRPGR